LLGRAGGWVEVICQLVEGALAVAMDLRWNDRDAEWVRGSCDLKGPFGVKIIRGFWSGRRGAQRRGIVCWWYRGCSQGDPDRWGCGGELGFCVLAQEGLVWSLGLGGAVCGGGFSA